MPGAAFLTGDRLTLRTVTPEDCQFIDAALFGLLSHEW